MTDLPPVFVDFEARSRVDLAKAGGRVYAEDPTTEVLCAVMYNGLTRDWGAWCPRLRIFTPVFDDRVPFRVVAHNATGFDRHIWRKLGWPEPADWLDTAEWARMGGFPKASLGALAQRLLGRTKDIEGNKLTRSLSHKRHHDGHRWAPVPEDTLRRVVTYCAQDVQDLIDLYPHLAPYAGNDLPGLREADRAINDRGFAFDHALAQRLIVLSKQVAANAVAQAGTTGEAVRSPMQLTALLAQFGVFPPDCRAATLEGLLEEDLPTEARMLIQARLASTPIAGRKLEAALRRLSNDGRLRDTLAYFGADRTGRWAGRGLQPQNLPGGSSLAKRFGVPKDQIDGDVEEGAIAHAVDWVNADGVPTHWGQYEADDIATMARACIIPSPGCKLVIADASQIEARIVAWCAGDTRALALFASGGDPYVTMAAELFGVPPVRLEKHPVAPAGVTEPQRKLGKIAELACGYGMGHIKFEATARAMGVDWATVPFTPKTAVDKWRALHRPIRDYWYATERAVKAAIGGQATACGPVLWFRSAHAVHCRLPSGRLLTYHNLRHSGSGLVYDGRTGDVHVYGGKFVENIVQAIARDILGLVLVRAEESGWNPVLHIHDEVVLDVLAVTAVAIAQALKAVMSRTPEWAPGLPCGCSVSIRGRYQK